MGLSARVCKPEGYAVRHVYCGNFLGWFFLFRFALEGGQVQPVFHGQKAHDDDGAAADEAGADGVEPEEVIAHAVDHASDDAGQGIDLFAEDKGHFVDEDIAKHTTRSLSVQVN